MKFMGTKLGLCLNLSSMIVAVILTLVDSVAAQRSSRWEEGALRLVGGRSKYEGTVLIYHWSRWGAICDDYWDIRDANVVCNELGYAGAKDAPRRSRFGKGRPFNRSGRVWLSGLHCRGNERHITMCPSRGWGNRASRCRSYWSSAGVVCNPPPTTTTVAVTTTTTTPKPKTTTTTTLKPKTTTTTTPKPKTTTTTTPKTTTTTTPKPKTTTTPTPKPTPTTKPITTTTPKHKTTTTKATDKTTTARPTTHPPRTTTTTPRPVATSPRVYNRWVYNREMWRYYMYMSDGTFITSRPDPRYYRNRTTRKPSTTTTTTTTTTTPRPRRINSNSISNSIYRQDNNDVMDNYINPNIEPESPRRHSSHRHRHDHHRGNSVKDGYLLDQPVMVSDDAGTDKYTPDDDVSESETPFDDVAVDEKVEQPPDYTEYRLVGGREYANYKEGRVEVRLANSFKWGVICGDNWNIRDAIVVCRHFNVGYARTAQTTDHYGGSDMDKVVAEMRCTGKETRLEDCKIGQTLLSPGKISCSRPQSVAGVICDAKLPDLVPDIRAVQESVFLRDRYLYYLQCAYEENCLSSTANDLYGTRTWAYATRRLLHFSTIAKNIGTADFRPIIDRSQWEWHACHQHYHSMESFSHYDIIDEHGNKVAEGHKASFCLEDSQCERGVYPKYDCESFGQQGISVGCQDNYLSDIDCQWIDVTDVKPGHYTFKIELNPSMLVAELSFENNVVVCDLYFNTRTATLGNCRQDGLL